VQAPATRRRTRVALEAHRESNLRGEAIQGGGDEQVGQQHDERFVWRDQPRMGPTSGCAGLQHVT
jgi:hypothetical protein